MRASVRDANNYDQWQGVCLIFGFDDPHTPGKNNRRLIIIHPLSTNLALQSIIPMWPRDGAAETRCEHVAWIS